MGPEDGDRVGSTITRHPLAPSSDGPQGLTHGLSIPAIIWKNIAPVLASHGCRVLPYDLHCRGYSDVPQVTHDESLDTTQLA
ncbi:hypothetical protein M404DRAFT_764840 [Pisolithus tinctorius Marx 270]|uniref:AB hydrolase-1 domain-containing protein n=1 Tax=Pisolithus tinctorius Marx 270 TaxID=870435 RepID=A0A0C3NZE9_PISTI|nr:hypothetical protein M404DRAFT_764840 [Pisolithus tinctorius Marx 270]